MAPKRSSYETFSRSDEVPHASARKATAQMPVVLPTRAPTVASPARIPALHEVYLAGESCEIVVVVRIDPSHRYAVVLVDRDGLRPVGEPSGARPPRYPRLLPSCTLQRLATTRTRWVNERVVLA